MSVSNIEIFKANCMLHAYIEVQNDWTGQVRSRIATIVSRDGRKHIYADGRKIDVTTQCYQYEKEQEHIKEALEWYRKTKF